MSPGLCGRVLLEDVRLWTSIHGFMTMFRTSMKAVSTILKFYKKIRVTWKWPSLLSVLRTITPKWIWWMLPVVLLVHLVTFKKLAISEPLWFSVPSIFLTHTGSYYVMLSMFKKQNENIKVLHMYRNIPLCFLPLMTGWIFAFT